MKLWFRRMESIPKAWSEVIIASESTRLSFSRAYMLTPRSHLLQCHKSFFARRQRAYQLMGWDAGPCVHHLKLKDLILTCDLDFPYSSWLGLIRAECEKIGAWRNIEELCVFVLGSYWGLCFQNGSQNAGFLSELASPEIFAPLWFPRPEPTDIPWEGQEIQHDCLCNCLNPNRN